jgi:hypothetical protein
MQAGYRIFRIDEASKLTGDVAANPLLTLLLRPALRGRKPPDWRTDQVGVRDSAVG